MNNADTLPDQLRRARTDAGLTQVEVARRLGCTNVHICQIEHAARSPSIGRLKQLATLYKVVFTIGPDDTPIPPFTTE